MTDSNPRAGSFIANPAGAALLLLAAFSILLVMMAAFASPAHADILRVTNKNDSGSGSLRAAVQNAAPSGDTIVFGPKVRGTITLTGRYINIDKNITIRGPGAGALAISGNNNDGVFYVRSGKTVRISGLTITKGSTFYGGGIDNDGNLTLMRSVVRGNSSGGYGGGINNRNVLRLIESTVSGNYADRWGGGIRNNYGTLIVQRSTISGNRAEYGGGIHTRASSNFAPTKTVVANSTISGNSISSADGAGGGIYNGQGLTEINNTTITNNTAPSGRGAGVASNGYRYVSTRVSSSIISANRTGGAVDIVFGSTNSFVSNGYNLIGYGSGAGPFNKTGDQRSVDTPGIGSLASNGGPTRTHALQSGSPAINTGSPTNCPAVDQRGAKRPHEGRCDKGSFEFGAALPR